MAKRRIPQLQTDQAAAAYWDGQSFADAAEDTTDATIRLVKEPKPTIKRRSIRSSRLHASTTGGASSRSRW